MTQQTALIVFIYNISAIFFILGLKMMTSPHSAKKGNIISATGMIIAIIATLFIHNIINYELLSLAIVIGTIIGIFSARVVKMPDMPQMVAIFNGFGGGASFLLGWAVFLTAGHDLHKLLLFSIFLAVSIGAMTLTGSIAAFFKLAALLPGKPLAFKGQKYFNLILFIVITVAGCTYSLYSIPYLSLSLFSLFLIGALIFGVTMTLPVGGPDMPVVISMLNSLSGLAAAAAGFVILNTVLIVAGALVGAAGLILTIKMSKAMNRSIEHIIFSGYVKPKVAGTTLETSGEIKSISAEDAYYVLEAASSVIIVPGFGMAVAQAQHVVSELGELLEENDTEVKYAIHPVAGRMPGHMNVLLAEANVPYEELVEPDAINPQMYMVDVCLVIGANDVVNPSAKDDQSSPLYGMPIIEAEQAKNVFVLKRTMHPGFTGVQNPLFYKPNTSLLFGDAKASITRLITLFKSEHGP